MQQLFSFYVVDFIKECNFLPACPNYDQFRIVLGDIRGNGTQSMSVKVGNV